MKGASRDQSHSGLTAATGEAPTDRPPLQGGGQWARAPARGSCRREGGSLPATPKGALGRLLGVARALPASGNATGKAKAQAAPLRKGSCGRRTRRRGCRSSVRGGLRMASAGSSAGRRTSGTGLPGSIALGECTAPDAETRNGAGRWEGERSEVVRVHPRSLRYRGVGERHTGPGMTPSGKVGAGMEGAGGARVARPGDATSEFGGVLTTHRAPSREIR